MEDQSQIVLGGTPEKVMSLSRKAWTAYLRVALIGVILLMTVVPLAFAASVGIGAVILLGVIAYLVYTVLELRSYHLYITETGVWLTKGILPWTKTMQGVKWRDLDEAVYYQGMLSWLFRSHTIRVGHRFTKTSEIVVSHMAKAGDAAGAINAAHHDLLRQNRLN